MPITQIVSLADVRAHLRYPAADTVDDVAIQGFIDAASDVIDFECNIVVPQQFDESYDGGNFLIWTYHVPIISIELVQEGWGWTNYNLAYIEVNSPTTSNMFAYSIDEPSTGQISRRSGGNVSIPFMRGESNVRINYTAGRTSIPGAIRLAALELIAHWWQNSQQRHGSGAMGEYSYDSTNVDFTRTTGMSAINQGVPYRILELLKPYRRFPIIG